MSPKELQDYLLENWELLSCRHGVFCSCCGGRVIDAHIVDGAVVLSVVRNINDRLRELETENADLKRQVTEAISYILSNEGASMIDCRMCFFVSSCERKPQQCEPNYEMCLRAVRKYIEDSGE
jgi:hypothetical protein